MRRKTNFVDKRAGARGTRTQLAAASHSRTFTALYLVDLLEQQVVLPILCIMGQGYNPFLRGKVQGTGVNTRPVSAVAPHMSVRGLAIASVEKHIISTLVCNFSPLLLCAHVRGDHAHTIGMSGYRGLRISRVITGFTRWARL